MKETTPFDVAMAYSSKLISREFAITVLKNAFLYTAAEAVALLDDGKFKE